MKKLLVLIVVLAIAGGGYWYVKNQNHNDDDSFDIPGIAGLGSSSSTSSNSNDSALLNSSEILKTLSDDVQFVVQISAPRFSPVSSWANAEWARFNATKIFNKFEVSKNIWQKFEQGYLMSAQGDPEATEKLQKQLDLIIKTTQEVATQLHEIVVVGSGKTFSLGKQAEIPYVLASIIFNSDAPVSKLKTIIDTDGLSGTNGFKFDGIEITRVATASGANYIVHAQNPAKPEEKLSGSVVLDGKRILLLFGTESEDLFKAGSGATSIAASPRWIKVSSSVPADSAMFVLFDPMKFGKWINSFIDKMSDMEKASMVPLQEMLSGRWQGMELAAYSTHFKNGLGGRQCVMVTPGSALDQLYTKFFDIKGEPKAHSPFTGLISARTMVALRLDTKGLLAAIEFMNGFYGTAMQASPSNDYQAFMKILNFVKTFGQKFNFSEVGITVNAPAGMPFPDGGLYFGESSLEGGTLLKEFSDFFNQLVQEMEPGKAAPVIAKVSKTTQGKEQIEIASAQPGEMGIPVVGGIVGSRSILFGLSEFFVDEGNKSISTGKSYLENFVANENPFLTEPGATDYFFYLNLEPALLMAKPYVPMLLGQQPESSQVKVDISDVEELFDILGGTMFYSQRSYRDQSKSVICTDSLVSTLQKKAK